MRDFINIVEGVVFSEAELASGNKPVDFTGFKVNPNREEYVKYMRGWCPYFALALHQLYGFDIILFGQHVLTRRLDGKYVDVRGVMSESEMKNGLDANFNLVPCSEQELIEELERGEYKCGLYSQAAVSKAKSLIRRLVG